MGDKKKSSGGKAISNFKLNALLDITLAINENLSTRELLERYEKLLKEDLEIGKVMIYKFSGSWECILSFGFQRILSDIEIEQYLSPIREISFISSNPDKISDEVDIIIPVFHKDQPIAYVLIGDFDEESQGISPLIKHLRFIQTLSNIYMVAIENQRLYNESLKQAAIKRELELASRMQYMLIPDKNKLPADEHLVFKSFYHPHYEVGGDYYDIIQLSADETGFCIADVSGKGISAAILMSNFQANLRALFTRSTSLESLIRTLNQRVLESANGEKFITLFIAKYNYPGKKLEYINAGHTPALLYNMKNAALSFLTSDCVGLGMVDDIPAFHTNLLHIDSPFKLLCYTDGLVEHVKGDNVDLDYKNIEEKISNQDSLEDNIREIIVDNKILQGNTSFFDDISILGVQFSGK